VGAYLMADIAHYAGLIAAGSYPSPVGIADFVTSTTHKTLRGPRGGLIFCREDLGKAVDKSVFPGTQGGPLMHVIAAKAVALKLAATDEYRDDQRQTIANAKLLAATLTEKGARVVSGGTDNHLMLVDVAPLGVTGKEAEHLLDEIGITVNKNAIPFDKNPPNTASGIRVGTPATTSRGFREPEMRLIGETIVSAIATRDDPAAQARLATVVHDICARFPVPGLRED
jgi:glycine hydroxymethyltransferase